MDVKKVADRICKEWDGLDFEVEMMDEGKKVQLTANIVAKKYFDDGVFLKIIIYSSGTTHMFFTFDQLDPTLRNYEMINAFNENLSWLKAYITVINDKRFLELHYASANGADEFETVDTVSFIMNQLTNDDTLEYLQPLTRATY